MRLQAVTRNSENYGVDRDKFRIQVTELLRLGRAAGCAVLGVEIDDHDLAGLRRKVEVAAAGCRQGEVLDLAVEHGFPLGLCRAAILVNGQGCGQVVKLRGMQKILAPFLLAAVLAGCSQPWNDPYPAASAGRNVLYAAFTDRPKHLDPAQSYTEDEITFTAQIYEPPLQYHYLKRPYELIPATMLGFEKSDASLRR